MAVMLVVTEGVPDDVGKSLNLTDLPGATLGRGVGSSLRLADPAWGGRVRVDRVAGVYRVTNEMGHTISLGDENLPNGAAGTWYNGVELQATADTCLALRTDKDAPVEAAGGEPAWRRAGSVGVILAALVIVPAVVFLDQSETSTRPATPGEVRQEYVELTEALGKVKQEALAPAAGAALAELQAARLAEVWNRPAEAVARYQAAREALDRGLLSLGGGVSPAEREQAIPKRARELVKSRTDQLDEAEAGLRLFARARDFVGDRLVVLTVRVKAGRR